MQEFKNYHPVVNFTYFLFVIIFTCVFMHPVTLLISLLAGITYCAVSDGVMQMLKRIAIFLPTLIVLALINPLFNHQGVTILAYFPWGNPITLESVIYGIFSAIMIISVFLHLGSCTQVLTSDKYMYLFGKIFPALSLVFSMILSFIPKFIRRIKIVADSQKTLGRGVGNGNIFDKIKNGARILFIMISWSFESAVDTSDSMKSRGYGVRKRTSFSVYKLSARDVVVLLIMVLSSAVVIYGGIAGKLKFSYYPCIENATVSLYGIIVFCSYMLFMFIPVFIEVWEVIKWKYIK